jgi:hypothetical protein
VVELNLVVSNGLMASVTDLTIVPDNLWHDLLRDRAGTSRAFFGAGDRFSHEEYRGLY